jgi:hypothetical protein
MRPPDDRPALTAGGHHDTPHGDGGHDPAGCDHIATTSQQWIIDCHVHRHTRTKEATAFPQVETPTGGSPS